MKITDVLRRHSRESRLVLAGTVLSVGATACGHIGNADLASSTSPAQSSTVYEILPGANVRTDPAVLFEDNDGGTNLCDVTTTAIDIVSPTVYSETGTADGDWTGFKRAELAPYIGKACGYDADGILWINDQKISQP